MADLPPEEANENSPCAATPLVRTTEFHCLGQSGLRFSRLCLGTANFGSTGDPSWVLPFDTAAAIFDRYLAWGGTAIDTADDYHGGESESWVGRLIEERQCRDQLILMTKISLNISEKNSNPNGCGNGRVYLRKALFNSLQRLKTNSVDVLWLHHWDKVTPFREVVHTMNDLVSNGSVRYYGFSNFPAWYVASAHAYAEQNALHAPIGIQMQYSLIERSIELEHIPMIANLGMGLVAWGALANGLLTGKYRFLGNGRIAGEGRMIASPITDSTIDRLTDRSRRVCEAINQIAKARECAPSQVAIGWLLRKGRTTSIAVGARTLSQLETALDAPCIGIEDKIFDYLDDLSKPPATYPYTFHDDAEQRRLYFGFAGKSQFIAEPVIDWQQPEVRYLKKQIEIKAFDR